jgi:hypothetical protein
LFLFPFFPSSFAADALAAASAAAALSFSLSFSFSFSFSFSLVCFPSASATRPLLMTWYS